MTGEPAPPARPAYVRVCPVCDTANPPERARCACGASLAGIDFSLLAPAPATPPAPTPAESPALAAGADGRVAQAPELGNGPPPVPTPLVSSPAPLAPPPAASAPPASAALLLCPHADCRQPNPPDSERCVYCNRPLHADVAVEGARPLPRALREAAFERREFGGAERQGNGIEPPRRRRAARKQAPRAFLGQDVVEGPQPVGQAAGPDLGQRAQQPFPMRTQTARAVHHLVTGGALA